MIIYFSINIGFIWIELIFAETENWNWKHCSKIIFKRVNSTMGLIFNEKVAEKCNLWDLWIVHGALFIVDKSTIASWIKKKKKNRNAEQKHKRQNQCNPNGYEESQNQDQLIPNWSYAITYLIDDRRALWDFHELYEISMLS